MEPKPNSNCNGSSGGLLAMLLCGAMTLPLLASGHHFITTATTPPKPAKILIAEGSSFSQTAALLAQRGIVSSAFKLKILACFRGSDTHVQAGRYFFVHQATPGQVLDRLVAGDILKDRLTVPEGWTAREIADRISETGREAPEVILRLVTDPDFIRKVGVAAPSLEGYLFPATYDFPEDLPTERLLENMVKEFHLRLGQDLQQEAVAHGLTLHQWVTLASIIQKESGKPAEMPLISAVFHNRLKKGIPLQADPTVIYGIPNFSGSLTRRNLLTATPYNTYQITGLPPGPISNPGMDALRAAVRPAPVDHLYFVARGDGSHCFSNTLRDHNEAVSRYRKQKR